MAYPLLATKFYVPTLRPGVISRPRLLERFGTSLRHKLILVSAPAGFGKTTAINEWIAGLSGSVAWLSLDMGDNDPIRFWTYLIAALQTVQPGLGESAQEMLHNPQPLPLEAILTALINEIASSPKTLVLVLDDYHQIEAQAVHDGLIFLLENQPQNFHLVVAGRSDPPWPLARLRGRQEVAEFREQDLRFDAEETTAFLNRSMHLDLSEVDILALKEHTEGWIAGLQMAALSLRGQDDAHRFVTSFTASNRFIFDYLIEEVLRKQSAEVQDFLLKTSILDQLCGPLCDAVLERANSQQVLEYLDRAHLFLTPLDDQRNWYRYHHLFADLLRGQLEKNLPEHADLHRRACGWLEARGFSANALGHALGAGDLQRAADIVEKNAISLIGEGQLELLASWLDALPDEMVQGRPWLCVAHAYVALYTGKLQALDRWMVRAEASLARREKAGSPAARGGKGRAEVESRRIAGHIAVIRAYGLGLKQAPDSWKEARRALELLPEDDWMARSFAATMLGIQLRREGRLDEAARAMEDADRIGEKAGNNHVAMLARNNLAGLFVLQGQLKRAEALWWQIVQADGKDGRRMPLAGLAYLGLSRIYRERNDLETALRYSRDGLEISHQWGHAEFVLTGHIDLAEVLLSKGDLQGARENMETAKSLRGEFAWPPWLASLEAEMALKAGAVEAAEHWAKETGIRFDDELDFSKVAVYVPLARLLIAKGRYSHAQTLLTRLLELSAAAGAGYRTIEILSLQAAAFHAASMPNEALAALGQALTLAGPEGFVRVILEAGGRMVELLRKAMGRGIAREYAAKLLAHAGGEAGAEKGSGQAVGLVEALSERELEILRLLNTSLDSNEIAQELYIAVSTVRTHIKRVYGKLGVNRRMEAIQRARELGLL